MPLPILSAGTIREELTALAEQLKQKIRVDNPESPAALHVLDTVYRLYALLGTHAVRSAATAAEAILASGMSTGELAAVQGQLADTHGKTRDLLQVTMEHAEEFDAEKRQAALATIGTLGNGYRLAGDVFLREIAVQLEDSMKKDRTLPDRTHVAALSEDVRRTFDAHAAALVPVLMTLTAGNAHAVERLVREWCRAPVDPAKENPFVALATCISIYCDVSHAIMQRSSHQYGRAAEDERSVASVAARSEQGAYRRMRDVLRTMLCDPRLCTLEAGDAMPNVRERFFALLREFSGTNPDDPQRHPWFWGTLRGSDVDQRALPSLFTEDMPRESLVETFVQLNSWQPDRQRESPKRRQQTMQPELHPAVGVRLFDFGKLHERGGEAAARFLRLLQQLRQLKKKQDRMELLEKRLQQRDDTGLEELLDTSRRESLGKTARERLGRELRDLLDEQPSGLSEKKTRRMQLLDERLHQTDDTGLEELLDEHKRKSLGKTARDLLRNELDALRSMGLQQLGPLPMHIQHVLLRSIADVLHRPFQDMALDMQFDTGGRRAAARELLQETAYDLFGPDIALGRTALRDTMPAESVIAFIDDPRAELGLHMDACTEGTPTRRTRDIGTANAWRHANLPAPDRFMLGVGAVSRAANDWLGTTHPPQDLVKNQSDLARGRAGDSSGLWNDPEEKILNICGGKTLVVQGAIAKASKAGDTDKVRTLQEKLRRLGEGRQKTFMYVFSFARAREALASLVAQLLRTDRVPRSETAPIQDYCIISMDHSYGGLFGAEHEDAMLAEKNPVNSVRTVPLWDEKEQRLLTPEELADAVCAAVKEEGRAHRPIPLIVLDVVTRFGVVPTGTTAGLGQAIALVKEQLGEDCPFLLGDACQAVGCVEGKDVQMLGFDGLVMAGSKRTRSGHTACLCLPNGTLDGDPLGPLFVPNPSSIDLGDMHAFAMSLHSLVSDWRRNAMYPPSDDDVAQKRTREQQDLARMHELEQLVVALSATHGRRTWVELLTGVSYLDGRTETVHDAIDEAWRDFRWGLHFEKHMHALRGFLQIRATWEETMINRRQQHSVDRTGDTAPETDNVQSEPSTARRHLQVLETMIARGRGATIDASEREVFATELFGIHPWHPSLYGSREGGTWTWVLPSMQGLHLERCVAREYPPIHVGSCGPNRRLLRCGFEGWHTPEDLHELFEGIRHAQIDHVLGRLFPPPTGTPPQRRTLRAVFDIRVAQNEQEYTGRDI